MSMNASKWNLVAAILATIGAGVCTAALLLSEWNFVNILGATGTGIGVLAGIAWIVSARSGINQ
jgi:hypothetical protein